MQGVAVVILPAVVCLLAFAAAITATPTASVEATPAGPAPTGEWQARSLPGAARLDVGAMATRAGAAGAVEVVGLAGWSDSRMARRLVVLGADRQDGVAARRVLATGADFSDVQGAAAADGPVFLVRSPHGGRAGALEFVEASTAGGGSRPVLRLTRPGRYSVRVLPSQAGAYELVVLRDDCAAGGDSCRYGGAVMAVSIDGELRARVRWSRATPRCAPVEVVAGPSARLVLVSKCDGPGAGAGSTGTVTRVTELGPSGTPVRTIVTLAAHPESAVLDSAPGAGGGDLVIGAGEGEMGAVHIVRSLLAPEPAVERIAVGKGFYNAVVTVVRGPGGARTIVGVAEGNGMGFVIEEGGTGAGAAGGAGSRAQVTMLAMEPAYAPRSIVQLPGSEPRIWVAYLLGASGEPGILEISPRRVAAASATATSAAPVPQAAEALRREVAAFASEARRLVAREATRLDRDWNGCDEPDVFR